MLTMPSVKKSLIVEQFQENYLNRGFEQPGPDLHENDKKTSYPFIQSSQASHESISESWKFSIMILYTKG